MPKAEQKKRQLRLGKEVSVHSKLFNFESVNPLLYQDRPIQLQLSLDTATSDGKPHDLKKYSYFGQASRIPKLASREIDLNFSETLLPRRQRLKLDPLSDEYYVGFHRRMKREEKSMSVADRNKMVLEIENLKAQLLLLRQHDWAKHLPRITVVNDTRDMREIERKRQLTDQEILRLLAKYEDWVRRDTKLQSDIRKFEKNMHNNSTRPLKSTRRYRANTNDDGDDDNDSSDSNEDSDESILTNNLAATKAKRQARRIKKYGPTIRLILGNGYEIVGGPLQHCRIEKTSDSK